MTPWVSAMMKEIDAATVLGIGFVDMLGNGDPKRWLRGCPSSRS